MGSDGGEGGGREEGVAGLNRISAPRPAQRSMLNENASVIMLPWN